MKTILFFCFILVSGSIFSQPYFKPEDSLKQREYEKHNFETYFMPGLAYTLYMPRAKDSVGMFQGMAVEYLIFSQIHDNQNSGPSHVRVYAKLNMMKSTKKEMKDLFAYTLGLDLSLEKNPKREYLVPYFGLELGGFSQSQIGTLMHFTPILGIHIVSKKNLFVNIHGGYVYPVTSFDILQGYFLQAGLNFALW